MTEAMFEDPDDLDGPEYGEGDDEPEGWLGDVMSEEDTERFHSPATTVNVSSVVEAFNRIVHARWTT